jgi:DNA-binding transcriptional MerR regulator
MTDQVVLPDDQDQFKLNEVCKVANVQPYMLRFWGTEFPQLEAAKSGTGQRIYSKDQVELILEIRRLLFDEGLTIAGARKKISAAEDAGKKHAAKAEEDSEEGAEEEVEEKAEERVEAEPEEKPRAPKTSSARRKTPKKKVAASKVDKETSPDVQPLLATLKNVRDEVEKILDDLKAN